MRAPKISGETMPPILKPVVTKPNTLPNEPGGVIARTIMSREGMMTPEKKPAAVIAAISAERAEIDFADQRRQQRHCQQAQRRDQRRAAWCVRPATPPASTPIADSSEKAGQRRIGGARPALP